ncbi:MAG: TrkA family potassium uptake protein, partial [Pirellulaceae bacterium]|nr:TrkA family potassium uptake protein [Pirellulaceae bacterium]
LEHYHIPYSLLVDEVEEALRMHDLGLNVVVGNCDDPETWSKVRIENAAMVVSTANDFKNTSVAFTARGSAEKIPIITTASDEASIDILKLAGSDHVFRLEHMIGQSFARRTLSGDAKSHVIGKFDELLIAEATAHCTPLVGRSLSESNLRQAVGVTVLGVWERGVFEAAKAETQITENTILVLAGTKEHLANYDAFFCIYNVSNHPVLILGGGRVGRATAEYLSRRGIDYRIVELLPERIRDPEKYVLGSAADLAVLEQAGIRQADSVVITTHDDDVNVYLTIYCRQLRPDIQILSRATHERNVATLQRAKADTVLSYASMGAGRVMNLLEGNKIVMVAEGLDLFEVPVPSALVGRTIADSSIREETDCSVVAIRRPSGTEVAPDPHESLPSDAVLILIGTIKAEQRFLELYGMRPGNGQAAASEQA